MSTSQSIRTPSILVADDDPQLRCVLARELEQHGFLVDVAVDGEEALAKAARKSYLIVLADVRMPRVGGLALARRIRRVAGWPRIFLLTGLTDVRADDPAVEGVITKPWDIDQLVGRLMAVVGQAGGSRFAGTGVLRVLLVGEDESALGQIQGCLTQSLNDQVQMPVVRTVDEAVGMLEREDLTCVLLDLGLSGGQADRAVARLLRTNPHVPVVVYGARDQEARAFRAMRYGAHDFVSKDQLTSGALLRSLQLALDRRGTAERLAFMAHYDQLTSLPNRNMFYDCIGRLLANATADRPASLVVLNLDRFKLVNDTFGHDVGDVVLAEMAERLRARVRPPHIIARTGGDEFALLLCGDREAAVPDMDELLQTIARPLEINKQHIVITASAGASVCPDDGHEGRDLWRCALAAMGAVKHRGGNGWQRFSGGLQSKVYGRLHMEADLRQALDRHEFELHYQPQLDLELGQVVAVEALLRWRHPERGIVSPMEFIPLLEETGLILPVGEWILRQACEDVLRWRGMGCGEMRVAVNVAARQFQAPPFVDMVAKQLTETGCPSSAVELEVTESQLIQNHGAVLKTLGDLKQLGVRLALDDFGTGYSSLAYLRRFPIDVLKIDRMFVSDLDDPAGRSLVAGIIALAKSLRLDVLAEGVETPQQRDTLFNNGCSLLQGYLYARPMPRGDLESWLRLRGAA